MTYPEPDIEGSLVQLDGIPLAQVLRADESDTVLTNSLQRIVDGAKQQSADTVAAFNNYI